MPNAAPPFDVQGAIYLPVLSQELPPVLELLENRQKSLCLTELRVKKCEFFGRSEREDFERRHHPQELQTGGDRDASSENEYSGETLIGIGQAAAFVYRSCNHFYSNISETTSTNWIAKEFFPHCSVIHEESRAEDVGHGLAIMREFLLDFATLSPIKRLGFNITSAPTLLFRTLPRPTGRMLLCQPNISGQEIHVSGYGGDNKVDGNPSAELLHALSHWSYQHAPDNRGVLLRFKAMVELKDIVVFSCGYYRDGHETFARFKSEHECCNLCNALGLLAIGVL